MLSTRFGKVELKYYESVSIKHNWEVFIGGDICGLLHEIDGKIVGFAIDDDFTDSDDFNNIINMAENDLRTRILLK